LEIGCGDGRLLSALQAAGWQVLGVERSPDAALAARHRGVDVCVADVIALGLPTASCDLVIFWHALEHLADPRAALQEARRLLRDGGRLVVAAPNLASWQARLLGVRWYHLDVPRHLFHFTPPTLERLLQETGFQPVAWSFHQPAYELRGWFEALRSALPGPSLSVWAVWMLIAPLAYVWCLVADWAHAGAAMVVHARCRGTAASSPTR
jgi:SAM-dependent methyltransferase